VLAVLLAAGVAAGSAQNPGAQSVYSAFSVLARGKPTTRECEGFRVTTATLTGTATSPDPRLAGVAKLQTKIAVNPKTGYGWAVGALTVRSGRAQRLHAGLVGVVSDQNVVNGLVTGRVFSPPARLLANVSIVFNENFSFAAVRLGVESGKNSAVAYPGLRCTGGGT
jgi:hypothetical protein